jgi:acyl-CoA thioesterase FadM
MADPENARSPAAIRVRRRIEWMDTDAAGIYHYTTVFRLAEAAEAALATSLGVAGHMFGSSPRVGVAVDFRRQLRFNDVVDVDLTVDQVGRTSVRYALAITDPRGVCAEGSITACHIGQGGRPEPWPELVRRQLQSGGRRDERAGP